MLATIHWTIGHWGNWWVDNFYYYTSVWLASILLIYSRCGCLVTVSHKQCTNSNRKTCTDSNVGTTAKDDFWPNNLWLKPKYIIITVDNRILNFLDWILFGNFHWENVLNVHKLKKQRTLRKTGYYWAEEYTTSQLHCCWCTEVNKFLLAYVILLKHVYFLQYFACLHERIFNCCKRITVKLKLKFAIE